MTAIHHSRPTGEPASGAPAWIRWHMRHDGAEEHV
jgi:hypothetical protein